MVLTSDSRQNDKSEKKEAVFNRQPQKFYDE